MWWMEDRSWRLEDGEVEGEVLRSENEEVEAANIMVFWWGLRMLEVSLSNLYLIFVQVMQ